MGEAFDHWESINKWPERLNLSLSEPNSSWQGIYQIYILLKGYIDMYLNFNWFLNPLNEVARQTSLGRREEFPIIKDL